MMHFAEDPKPVIILDKEGKPLKADDPHRFFEASWCHKYKGKYYFSYSTGDTHMIILTDLSLTKASSLLLSNQDGQHTIPSWNLRVNGIFSIMILLLLAA